VALDGDPVCSAGWREPTGSTGDVDGSGGIDPRGASMVDLPSPAAARLRRPSWRDPRLIAGVLLVLASVALGSRVVAAADDTVPVWAAAGALPAGTALAADDMRVVRVRLGDGAARYLDVGAPVPPGSVLLRSLGRGELVPASAVGPPGAWNRRPVTVPVPGPMPGGLQVGALVDVWASARDTSAPGTASFRPPVRLARAAEVFSVSLPGTGLGSTQGAAVQVLLPEQELRGALDALANGARVALVPAPGSGTAPATGTTVARP